MPCKPIALSIDELKRIYLYIETPYVPFDGDDFKPGLTRELWVGNLQGERWIKLPLPGELPAGREDDDTSRVVPPIVGFDHAIYMVFTHGIVALEPDGSKRWEVTTPENVRGAIITVDDDLIATIGTKIVRIDRAGEMTTLFESTQGELISPPELGENLLYAMTERKVFRLRARVDGESQTKKEE